MAQLEELETQVLQGGEFIVKESTPEEIFAPEELSEEQRMFGQTTKDFVLTEVMSKLDRIEKLEEGLTPSLLEKAGELGLLGAGLPEQYGGMDLDCNSETVIHEELGKAPSFSVSVAAHSGIGTLPVLYYGTEAQKSELLPKLASGELKAAYCLTEPGSGSDALAAKTKAVLSEDGKHYIITGQKMWITNSGFADLFTVFAKVDGEKFTGFLVDAKSENISLGAEEHKMGIKGSSTRQVFFEGVKVPVENLLGEIGKGHKIAFNVLNIGRYKLCVMTIGGAKGMADLSIKYANERIQFKQPIANFGAIQHKLAQQAILIYAGESAMYRTSHLIQQKIDALEAEGVDSVKAKMQAAEEYSIECAMLKVFGSETLDYVVDEAVQIHGGMGFSEETMACKAYRDARINRIFEGTNEINRLLSVGMLLKKAMKGKIDIMGAGMAVQKELMSIPSFEAEDTSDIFAADKKAIKNAKKVFMIAAGGAAQKYMAKLEEQQEVMMYAADILMNIFVAESALLRVQKARQIQGEETISLQVDMVKVFIADMMNDINIWAKTIVLHFAEGDELRAMLMGIKRFTKYPAYDTIAARKRVASHLIEANEYCF